MKRLLLPQYILLSSLVLFALAISDLFYEILPQLIIYKRPLTINVFYHRGYSIIYLLISLSSLVFIYRTHGRKLTFKSLLYVVNIILISITLSTLRIIWIHSNFLITTKLSKESLVSNVNLSFVISYAFNITLVLLLYFIISWCKKNHSKLLE